jgi:hypothetical protein
MRLRKGTLALIAAVGSVRLPQFDAMTDRMEKATVTDCDGGEWGGLLTVQPRHPPLRPAPPVRIGRAVG